MRISRAERSVFGDWWYSLDARFLLALLLLMAVGLAASLAASPPVALRLDLEPFYFAKRHALMLIAAFFVLVGASVLTTRGVLLTALSVFAASLCSVVSGAVLGGECQRGAALDLVGRIFPATFRIHQARLCHLDGLSAFSGAKKCGLALVMGLCGPVFTGPWPLRGTA